MAQKNWFETISERVPAETKFEVSLPAFRRGFLSSLINEDPFGFDAHITPIRDLMEELEGVGFQDKDNHYEMVTGLGGNKDIKEDAVKIRLIGENEDSVEITYEHKSDEKGSFYRHSQKTVVTLPSDADADTLSAYFDDENNVVISVEKKKQKEVKQDRNIPIVRK